MNLNRFSVDGRAPRCMIEVGLNLRIFVEIWGRLKGVFEEKHLIQWIRNIWTQNSSRENLFCGTKWYWRPFYELKNLLYFKFAIGTLHFKLPAVAKKKQFWNHFAIFMMRPDLFFHHKMFQIHDDNIQFNLTQVSEQRTDKK